MKRLILTILVAAVIAGGAWGLAAGWVSPALAAGPSGAGNWMLPISGPYECPTPGGALGHWMVSRTGKYHCFKN